MGKGGGKKPKLEKKKKAKKKNMEKENDLVGSSQGSDSQLSEAEDKKLGFFLVKQQDKGIILF